MTLPLFRFPGGIARRAFRAGIALVLAVAASALAAERTVTITLAEKVPAGKPVYAAIAANTDFGGGEQIGFLHSEYSVDGGKTWKRFAFLTNVGPKIEHAINIEPGAAGSKIQVRVRAAFRGGKAGDVDVNGKKIEWDKSWNAWGSPPTKVATATVE